MLYFHWLKFDGIYKSAFLVKQSIRNQRLLKSLFIYKLSLSKFFVFIVIFKQILITSLTNQPLVLGGNF